VARGLNAKEAEFMGLMGPEVYETNLTLKVDTILVYL
jgi:hypothetical protein